MSRLLNLLRFLSGLLALCGLVAFTMWTWFPGKVHVVDRFATQKYNRRYGNETAEARRSLGKNPEAAAAILEELIEALSAARRGDVYFPKWRVAALLQSKALTKIGDLDGAIRVLDEFTKQDAHDIPVRLEAVRLLREMGSVEQKLEANRRARELFQWMPSLPMIASVHIGMLLESDPDGELGGALSTHLEMASKPEHLSQNLWMSWDIFWDDAQRFTGTQRARAKAEVLGELLTVRFDIPAGQNFIRIDPPLYSYIELGAPRLSLSSEGSRYEVEIGEANKRAGIKAHGLGLSVEGSYDPWIVVPLPPELAGKPMSGEFQADLNLVPNWLRVALAGPEGTALALNYAGESDWSRFSLVRGAWRDARRLRSVAVTSDEGQVGFGFEVDGMQLSFDIDWAGGTTHMKVQFPAEPGDSLDFESCLLTLSNGGTMDWTGELDQRFLWEGVHWEGTTARVTQSRPSLSWKAEAGQKTCTSLKMRGVLR